MWCFSFFPIITEHFLWAQNFRVVTLLWFPIPLFGLGTLQPKLQGNKDRELYPFIYASNLQLEKQVSLDIFYES